MNELLKRVAMLIDRALGFDLTVPNDTGHIDLDAGITATIADLVGDAIQVLETIERRFEIEGEGLTPPAKSGEISVLRAIGAEISSALARQEIADIAFVGRHQLTATQRRIAAAREAKSAWKILAHCETALRRSRKSLVAVESALREYAGLEAIPRKWESLTDALEIRGVYTEFRHSITRLGQPAPAELAGELRRVARRISILRDRTIYPYLRIEDRREIRQCQKRIDAWLDADDGSELHASTGARLWQDVVAFANLLTQVNHRQALFEHDRDVLAKALRFLGRRGASERPVPPEIREDLQTVFGRDDEIDGMLLDPKASECAGPWRAPLLRMLGKLDQPFRLPT